MQRVSEREIGLDYRSILVSETPLHWAEKAVDSLPDLLIDHAQCERKAAQSAMTLIFRYPHLKFVNDLSNLVREEMVHFENVLRFLKSYDIKFKSLKPSGYGAFLNSLVRSDHNFLIDHLIMNAVIEARSCERMKVFSIFLDNSLSNFYQKLHDAEKRHCLMYLKFAQSLSSATIDQRVKDIAIKEANWLRQQHSVIRFHSPHGS